MKAYELAEIYRGIAAGDDVFADVNLQVGQTSDRPVEAFPALVFDCSMRPIGGSAAFHTYELMITVLSNPEDDSGATHAELVEAVRQKFCGTNNDAAAAARAAVKALVEADGTFRVLGRGHDVPADPQRPGTEQSRFKTTLVLAGSVEIL